tara:strand:+ start:221 stop:355 length:135 start_codon:yes stop_codon:yes gene_type:complete
MEMLDMAPQVVSAVEINKINKNKLKMLNLKSLIIFLYYNQLICN